MEWESVEDAARACGVTARTIFRWLQDGKLKKEITESGDQIILLASSDNDMSITDDRDDVNDTLNDRTNSIDEMSFIDTDTLSGIDSARESRKSKKSKKSMAVDILENEVRAAKLQLELEKIEGLRDRYREKKELEKRKILERERLLEQNLAQQDAYEKKRGEVIKRVKEKIYPASYRKFLPPEAISQVYSRLDNFLQNLDILAFPFEELCFISKSLGDKILAPYGVEIQQKFRKYIGDQINEYCNQCCYESLVPVLDEMHMECERLGQEGQFWQVLERSNPKFYRKYKQGLRNRLQVTRMN